MKHYVCVIIILIAKFYFSEDKKFHNLIFKKGMQFFLSCLCYDITNGIEIRKFHSAYALSSFAQEIRVIEVSTLYILQNLISLAKSTSILFFNIYNFIISCTNICKFDYDLITLFTMQTQ